LYTSVRIVLESCSLNVFQSYHILLLSRELHSNHSNTNARTQVPLNAIEIRSLLNQRNVLATYLRKRVPRENAIVVEEKEEKETETKKSKDIEDTTFPPMLKNEFVCKSCYQLESCALYHATVEKGTLKSSGMDEKTWNSTVGHLTDQDKSYVVSNHIPRILRTTLYYEFALYYSLISSNITKTLTPTLEHRYFTHWENLLNLEAGDISSVRSALWRLPTTRRVREGTCVRPLMLSSHGTTEYTFVLGSHFVSEEEKKTLCKGDMIVVSFETQSTRKTHFAVGAGTLIVELTHSDTIISRSTHTHHRYDHKGFDR
jgi:hypothetical protein